MTSSQIRFFEDRIWNGDTERLSDVREFLVQFNYCNPSASQNPNREYNRFKYGDWSSTRILVAPGLNTNDGFDLEQQGSELETSLHIWNCYNNKNFIKFYFINASYLMLFSPIFCLVPCKLGKNLAFDNFIW